MSYSQISGSATAADVVETGTDDVAELVDSLASVGGAPGIEAHPARATAIATQANFRFIVTSVSVLLLELD